MDVKVRELKSSWNHCKKLLAHSNNKELVVAFLEEFKIQFTKFHHKVNSSLTTKFQQSSSKLVDRAFLFYKQEGELSRFISRVKKTNQSKKRMTRYIQMLDKIISAILTAHSKKRTTSS